MRTLILAGTSLLALSASVVAASAAPITFSYTGSLQTFTATVAGTYDIVAYGAQGGGVSTYVGNDYAGGRGAEIGGDVTLTQGEILSIAVGGTGSGGSNFDTYAGGGGGSFVVAPGGIPLVVAGGGGGAGMSDQGRAGQTVTAAVAGIGGSSGGADDGGGGGGFTTAGSSATKGAGGGGSYPSLLGGSGSAGGGSGGFGGGGGGAGGDGGGGPPTQGGSGGGGGYNGGNGGNGVTDAAGGTSYDAGLTNANLLEVAGENAGNGLVTINLLAAAVTTPTTVPEPASMALLGTGLLGMLAVRRRRQG